MKTILTSIQFILVSIFILFEEIIWEGLAKPIHNKIVSLNILVKLENIINLFNRYIILLFFTILLLGVEGVGILAGVFFVQGKITLGIVLYLIKIPIAGFTFWLFKVTKPKLLSFDWFLWTYDKLVEGINWLKKTDIYKDVIKLKYLFKRLKEKYLSKNSKFIRDLKSLYRKLKSRLKNG